MKKIGKLIYSVYKIFDKLLITPITKLILGSAGFFKDNSKGLERFINKKQTLIVLSLIFSFVVFFVVENNSNMIVNTSAEILYNQPVTAQYNEEAYVIEGLPEFVDVTLIGTRQNLYLAKQYASNLQISADLRELQVGKHKVTLKYTQGLSNMDYKIDPSTATIVVYEKVSQTMELDYDVLHKNNLDTKLVIKNIDLNRTDCIIKGAEYKLQQVATVKALVDIDNLTNPKAGTTALKDISLIAYDADGKIVPVEIVPSTVDAQIEIASPSKNVPVKIVPTGDLAFGKSIESMEQSITNITIYGDETLLSSIEYVPVEIDVNGLSSNKDYNVNIVKPSGVREMSAKTISVKVKLDDVITKEFTDIRITPVNLDPQLKVQATSEADSQVTVIVKGTKSVVESIDSTKIKATIDLKGYSEGEYKVNVQVAGEDLKALYESKTEKVTVKIIKQ